jgi:predicted HAD superfamily Cof-like phosphohydrolase
LAEWVESHAESDITAVADAWGDRLYVLLGDAVASGLGGTATAIFEEIHRSNLSKVRDNSDEFGKAVKGSGFNHPHLDQLVEGDAES